MTENDEHWFQMELNPKRARVVTGLSVVIHSSNTTAIVRGQTLQIFVKCENSTSVHFIQSYSITESDEYKQWLELSINLTSLPCSTSSQCCFSAHFSGDSSLLDTLLVAYDYGKHWGLSVARTTVQKRATDSIANKTLLSSYNASEINCSMHSVFLNFVNDLPIFDPTQVTVISPNRNGVQLTFCYGSCTTEYFAPPENVNSTTRRHFMDHLLQDENNPIPGPCCVPDVIENDEMLISDLDEHLIELYTFPQVATCKCSV